MERVTNIVSESSSVQYLVVSMEKSCCFSAALRSGCSDVLVCIFLWLAAPRPASAAVRHPVGCVSASECFDAGDNLLQCMHATEKLINNKPIFQIFLHHDEIKWPRTDRCPLHAAPNSARESVKVKNKITRKEEWNFGHNKHRTFSYI